MADPVWTNQYNLAQTPEQNGFTRNLYGNPTINAITSGTPANRRVELTTDQGGVAFVTSSVPSLNDAVGATAEVLIQTNGSGNAGFELTFLNHIVAVRVYQTKIFIDILDGQTHQYNTADNSGQTRIRFTYANGSMSLYRNAVLIDTLPVPVNVMPFQRVLWWGEEGGLQTWRELKYYIGGAVAP